MNTNRFFKVMAVIFVGTLAVLTISSVALPENDQHYQDYAQRHPVGVVIPNTGLSNNLATDYYQRHPSDRLAGYPLDTTEYFFRHPEMRGGIGSVDSTGTDTTIAPVYDATGAMLEAINAKSVEVKIVPVYDATGAMLEAINP